MKTLLASELYCHDCIVNTRDSVCLVHGPARTAPCKDCLERLYQLFRGPTKLVLERLLNSGVLVHVGNGKFDFTGFGQWVVGDALVVRRTDDGVTIDPPDGVIRSIMTIVAKFGSAKIVLEAAHVITEMLWTRVEDYEDEVAAAMNDGGADAWGFPSEPDNDAINGAIHERLNGFFQRAGEGDAEVKAETIEQFLAERGNDISPTVADAMRRYIEACREPAIARA